ncbi:MAG: hypothetical protein QOE05_1292 [Actinomycetota bacterium]|jgi:hypothetical protein|nr:hypothetical protein [Actinomycetota bacterium]
MRLRTLLVPLLSAAALTMGGVTVAAPAAAVAPDPAVLGSHTVQTFDYDAGDTFVTDPTTFATYPERLEGAIYVPSGTGPFPVLLFMHGRHDTCAVLGVGALGPPHVCPDNGVTTNIRSYRGYAYLATNLASHGYLVISVSANSINTFDWAGDAGADERSQVIARSLDKLGEWNTTAGPGAVGTKLIGKVDLSSIGIMGHSRGGEGVDHFAAYNKTRTDGPRYTGLKAVFALAPTDFGAETVQGVHFATLLPLCDGDVYDLQGSQAYDRGRFLDPSTGFTRAQYTVSGTNHNWFNTVWTGDDYMDFDGGDPACTPGDPASTRLTESEQRDIGLTLMASFFRRWVGGETAFTDLLKGAEPLPASACPGSATTCPTLVRTSWLGAAADRTIVATPNAGDNATTTGGTVTGTGFTTFTRCTPTTSGTGCPTNPTRGLASQFTLKWAGPATLTVPVSATGYNASGMTALTFRTAMNYADASNASFAGQNFSVVVKDALGATSSVNAASYTESLRKQAGASDRELTLDGVWIPLSAFSGIDKTKVTSVELRFGTLTASGSVQLAEVGFQK